MKTILYLLPVFILASCQQALVPSAFLEKEKLSRFIVKEQEGVAVIMENIEVTNDLIIFDVEVQNHSERFTYVDPTMFYYFSYADDPADHADISFNDHHYAMDEHSTEKHLEKKIKERKAGNIALAILGVGLIVADAYLDSKDESKPVSSEGEYKKLVKSNALRDAGTAAGLMAIDIAATINREKAMEADEDIYYLPDEYLRETVLAPGDKCRGKVFFKKGPELSSYYRFYAPIEELQFVMDFKRETNKDRRAIKNNFLE